MYRHPRHCWHFCPSEQCTMEYLHKEIWCMFLMPFMMYIESLKDICRIRLGAEQMLLVCPAVWPYEVKFWCAFVPFSKEIVVSTFCWVCRHFCSKPVAQFICKVKETSGMISLLYSDNLCYVYSGLGAVLWRVLCSGPILMHIYTDDLHAVLNASCSYGMLGCSARCFHRMLRWSASCFKLDVPMVCELLVLNACSVSTNFEICWYLTGPGEALEQW